MDYNIECCYLYLVLQKLYNYEEGIYQIIYSMCGYNNGYKFKNKCELQEAIINYYIHMHPLFCKLEKITIENKFKYGTLSLWDVSLITDMSSLFYDLAGFSSMSNFNPTNIIKIDEENNINFYVIKKICKIFNENINFWDVSNVKTMTAMFYGCYKFNQNLNLWDVSNVTDMSDMFRNCKDFNGNLSNWDVSNVDDMSRMFSYCKNFNGDLNLWDVSKVTDMNGIFYACKKYNKDLNLWDVSKVTDMNGIFYACKKFNKDLNLWDVSKVTDMNGIFYTCKKFNKDLNNWNISNVISMNSMFENCIKFNKNISSWDLKHIEPLYKTNMLNKCVKLKKEYYPQNL
jgi:surface protein